MSPDFSSLAFYLLSAFALGFAGLVAFSRSIVYSAFGLLGCFSGVAGLYILLHADFVGVLQLFVYVGGITVLIVFAVMLTNEIGEVKISNQVMNPIIGFLAAGGLFYLLRRIIVSTPWVISSEPPTATSTVEPIGHLLLTKYLFPFELVSVLLLVALIGAIVIARKTDDAGRQGGGRA